MTPDTQRLMTGLLISDRLDEFEAMALCAMMRVSERNHHRAEGCDTQNTIVTQDRDNRRRRMDLALALLDETRTDINLDSVAALVWKEPADSDPLFNVTETADGQPVYIHKSFVQTVPFPGDPTQHPTDICDLPRDPVRWCDGEHAGPACGDLGCWHLE